MAIALSFVLIVSLSLTTFAAWPSFQNDNTNNGIIPTSPPPPITAPSPSNVDEIPLTNNGAWIGVDVAPIIYNDTVYTLHNGGDGAYLASTPLPGSTNPTWDVNIDPLAGSGDTQLSTPYATTINNEDIIFVGTTHSVELFSALTYSGWTSAPTNFIDGSGVATFPSTGGSVETTIELDDPVSTLTVQTNLNLISPTTSASYLIELIDSNNVSYVLASYTITSNANYGSTYDTYNGAQIPAGEYTLKITVTPSGGTVTASTFFLGGFNWQLNVVTDLDSLIPTWSIAQCIISGRISEDVAGEGQFNTPISYDNSGNGGYGNIYFGIWGGTHSYYQYTYLFKAPPRSHLNVFTPTVAGSPSGYDDFYNAGAYSDGTNVYFGSDNGIVYQQPVSGFGSTAGNPLTLISSAGKIRSSMAFDGTSLYFTSQGTGSNAYIWRILPGQSSVSTADYTTISVSGTNVSTSSTPVISANNYVYVGYNTTNLTSGGVVAYPKTFTSVAPGTAQITIYTGDPVQASPIVFSDDGVDYIYFTTNSYQGAGCCYFYDIGSNFADELWSIAGTSGNPYAIQGFAADFYDDVNYLVYGDDGNFLYIFSE